MSLHFHVGKIGAPTKLPTTGSLYRLAWHLHVMLLLLKLWKSTETNQMGKAKAVYSELAIYSKGVSRCHLQRLRVRGMGTLPSGNGEGFGVS